MVNIGSAEGTVKINASGATSGAAEANKAFDSVGDGAKRNEKIVSKAGKDQADNYDDARRLRNVQHLLELVRDDLDIHRQELAERVESVKAEDPHEADALEFNAQGMGELIGQLQAAIDSATALVDGFQ